MKLVMRDPGKNYRSMDDFLVLDDEDPHTRDYVRKAVEQLPEGIAEFHPATGDKKATLHASLGDRENRIGITIRPEGCWLAYLGMFPGEDSKNTIMRHFYPEGDLPESYRGSYNHIYYRFETGERKPQH